MTSQSPDRANQVLFTQLRHLLDHLAMDEIPAPLATELSESLRTVLGSEWAADHDLAEPGCETRFGRSLPTDRAPVLTDFAAHPSIAGLTALHPPFNLDPHTPTRCASVTFGPAHEGFPGMVHGGYLLALCDVVGGQIGATSMGVPAITRSVSAKFVRPCPLRTNVTASATLPDDGDGTHVKVRLFDDDSDRTFVIAQVHCAPSRPADDQTGGG